MRLYFQLQPETTNKIIMQNYSVITHHRQQQQQQQQHHRQFVIIIIRQCSGLRLQMDTDAARFSLEIVKKKCDIHQHHHHHHHENF